MRKKLRVSRVIEDYLVTIARLEEEYGVARTTDIAKALGVKPGTVINTIERLKACGYVERIPYRGIRLTEKGREIAMDVLRRHRLAERLLTDILEMDIEKVHEIAHRLEHDIADIEEYIERKLKDTKTCPHGKPIPPRKTEREILLCNAEEGKVYRITRITLSTEEDLEVINSLGLKPGTILKVKSREPKGSIKVQVNDNILALEEDVLKLISVTEVR